MRTHAHSFTRGRARASTCVQQLPLPGVCLQAAGAVPDSSLRGWVTGRTLQTAVHTTFPPVAPQGWRPHVPPRWEVVLDGAGRKAEGEGHVAGAQAAGVPLSGKERGTHC